MPRNDDDDDDRPRRRRPRDDDEDDRPARSRRRNEDDDELPPRRKRRVDDDDDYNAPAKKKGGSLLVILGIVGGVLLLCCGGGGFGFYYLTLDAREAQKSSNNLKEIGLAFHNYHDVNGSLPNNSYTPDGKPLLSWRVHILPFVGESALYQQFNLNEPWDSPTTPLDARMPRVRNANSEIQGGMGRFIAASRTMGPFSRSRQGLANKLNFCDLGWHSNDLCCGRRVC